MSSRTHFLSLLVVCCAAFPAQLFRIGLALTAAGPAARSAGGRVAALLRQVWLPAGFILVAALVWYVAPSSGVLNVPAGWWWCAVGLAAGMLAPGLEVGTGAAVALLRRQRVARVRLHERWSGGAGAVGVAAVAAAVVVAVAEETIFRGVALHLLSHPLGWPVGLAVAVTAVAYSLNHLYFGWLTVLQKLVTGLLLGGLYVAAGYSLLVPLLAHVAQNLVVLVVLPRLTSRPPSPEPTPTPVGVRR